MILARQTRRVVGFALRAERRVAGLEQGDVAGRVGVSQSVMSRMEAGAVPISVDRALALLQIYGVPAGAFFAALDGLLEE